MIIHIFQLPVCRILQPLQEPLVSSACQDGYLVCSLESTIQNSNEICVCCKANIQGLDTKQWQHCCNLKDVQWVALLSSVPDSRSSVEVVQ